MDHNSLCALVLVNPSKVISCHSSGHFLCNIHPGLFVPSQTCQEGAFLKAAVLAVPSASSTFPEIYHALLPCFSSLLECHLFQEAFTLSKGAAPVTFYLLVFLPCCIFLPSIIIFIISWHFILYPGITYYIVIHLLSIFLQSSVVSMRSGNLLCSPLYLQCLEHPWCRVRPVGCMMVSKKICLCPNPKNL